MGAIYGLFGSGSMSALITMGERLQHRGSVTREVQLAPHVFFGQRDTVQPDRKSTPAHVPVVADATLFNTSELVEQLETWRHVDDTQCTAQLIHAAFEHRGPTCFSSVNGDYVIALWDERVNRLVLVRDPLGARSLYFYQGAGYFAFASEYKALLALDDVQASPDLAALQYLQRSKYLPSGRTLLSSVQSVPGGHWVEVRDGDITKQRYWDVGIKSSQVPAHVAEATLRERFVTSIERRIAGEDVLGIELSGGVDSAAIVAVVRKLRPDSRLITFTAGAGPDDPEIQSARIVAEQFQTEHHEVFVEPEHMLECLPKVVWALEDPIGRTEGALSFQLMDVASAYVDVVLGGYASDGLYAGMPRHKLVKLMQLLPVGRHALEEFYQYTQVSHEPRSVLGKAIKQLYFGRTELPAPTILGAPSLQYLKPLPNQRKGLLNEVLRAGVLNGVPVWMPKVEKPHAAHGVEVRSPFTDPDLIRHSFELPEHFKLRGLNDKYILRRALMPLLPDTIANRPKFPQRMDYDLRLSNVLDVLAAQFLEPEAVQRRGFFDATEIAALRTRPIGTPYSGNRAMQLWTAISTEIWARIFLDNRGDYPSYNTMKAVEVTV